MESVPLEPLGQSSSFGMPFAFFSGLQMSIVKVVFVIVGEGEWSSLVITDMGLPRADMSKDCLSSRMLEQSRLMADVRAGRRRRRTVEGFIMYFRDRILMDNMVLEESRLGGGSRTP